MKDLYAYLLVRTDLPSLGAGKAHAHAMHAGNQMTWREVVMPMSKGETPNEDIMTWHNSAGGFGTTIALGDKNQLDFSTIADVVETAKKLGFVASLVVDPTYPYLVDYELSGLIDPSINTMPPVPGPRGYKVHFRKEVTTAYVFGDKARLKLLLSQFGLAPND